MHKRFVDNLMSLLVSSLRPVQWILGFCGLVAVGGVYAAHDAGIWNPTELLQSMITLQGVLIAFLAYSILSFTSALYYNNTRISIQIRWAAALIGSSLWIACLSSSFTWVMFNIKLRDGMNLLYCIPLIADTWVMVQLIAKVHVIERRDYD